MARVTALRDGAPTVTSTHAVFADGQPTTRFFIVERSGVARYYYRDAGLRVPIDGLWDWALASRIAVEEWWRNW